MQAYLNVEDEASAEPYLHGVKYTAIPPAKRYRDMDGLSGALPGLRSYPVSLFCFSSFVYMVFGILKPRVRDVDILSCVWPGVSGKPLALNPVI